MDEKIKEFVEVHSGCCDLPIEVFLPEIERLEHQLAEKEKRIAELEGVLMTISDKEVGELWREAKGLLSSFPDEDLRGWAESVIHLIRKLVEERRLRNAERAGDLDIALQFPHYRQPQALRDFGIPEGQW